VLGGEKVLVVRGIEIHITHITLLSIQTRIVSFNFVGYNIGFRTSKILIWDFQTVVYDGELRFV